MTANRKDARKALAALLETALVGVGLPAQAVYDFQVGDFGANNPVVVVTSTSADRSGKLSQSRYLTVFGYEIHLFVLYALEDGTWTEENAEDALDTLEMSVFEVLRANAVNRPTWEALLYTQPSEADSVIVAGLEYKHEVITVQVRVMEQ